MANRSDRYDIATLRNAATDRWRDILVNSGIPAEALRNQHGPCPGCGGRDRFRFDDKDGHGTFYCSGGGDEHAGDGFALLQHAQGWTFGEAAQCVADYLGISRGTVESRTRTAERSPAQSARTPWRPILPVPESVTEPPKAHIKRGRPEKIYTFYDVQKSVNGYVYRFRTSDGGKEVLPLVWARHEITGDEEWRWMAFPEPRPLYGLDRLADKPTSPVLIVEGEPCADAADSELRDFACITWPGGCKAADKAGWDHLAGRDIFIWPDCDAQRVPLTRDEKDAGVSPESKPLRPETEQPGTVAAERIASRLSKLGCRVSIVRIPAPGEKPAGWDIADAIAEGLNGQALAEFIRSNLRSAAPAVEGGQSATAGAGTPNWMTGMLWKARGQLEECRENVFLILTQHPEWQGRLGYDEFARRVVLRESGPIPCPAGEWTSEHDFEFGLWLAQKVRLVVKGEGAITSGVAMAAARAKFHPVREMLESLPPWDGTKRVEYFLEECLGASAENSAYPRIVGRLFLVGMVARVMEPGCQWDYMPILEGPQGRGKSSALRILGGQWFADTPLKLGDKDAYMALDGIWLQEVGEMDSFNRAETTLVKAFVTSRVDHYREPYARRAIDRPRQVSFAGTTNHGEYLKDTTGNRRFWPVRLTGRLDLDKLASWRDALFAEALHCYRTGAPWRPTRDEEALYIQPEQEAREIVDPWLYRLADWLDEPERRWETEYTSLELLRSAIGMEAQKIDNNRGAATRIGNLMARLGWSKSRRSTGRRDWVYRRPKNADDLRTAPAIHGGEDE